MPGGPGRGPGAMGRPDGQGPRQGEPGGRRDWFKSLDINKDGNFDPAELQIATDRTFAELDRDHDGSVDNGEGRMPPPPGDQPGGDVRDHQPQDRKREDKGLLPPFFFDRAVRDSDSLTKEQFTSAVRGVFNELDSNKDGVLSKEESRPPRDGGPRGGEPGAPPPPPNAQFIAAELRFGDKLIQGHPFSAETVIEDTRRLYDGTAVTKSMKGAIYRNTAGSTRREQPMEMIAGVQISGADGRPQNMVFINDFAAKTQTFLDVNNKLARTHPIGDGPRPEGPGGPVAKEGEKSESLGSKTIDGVKVEGTRMTFEIPAGHLGNDKPIEVLTENWFSPELGVIVMSRHVDPIAGEHIFRLTNIRLGEPSSDLFTVPQGYRVENGGGRRPHEE